MPPRKFNHHDEAIILASLHLPPREIEIALNRARGDRGEPAVTFTRTNKQRFQQSKDDIDIRQHVPELDPTQRVRELKAHLDTLQVSIEALKTIAIKSMKKPQEGEVQVRFEKGEARELSNLSRELRNTLKDIGDLAAAVLPKEEEPEAEVPPEEKYAEQLPPNVVAMTKKTAS